MADSITRRYCRRHLHFLRIQPTTSVDYRIQLFTVLSQDR